MTAVRLVRVVVQFDAVADDGENLTPLPQREAAFTAADLDRIPELIRAALADIEETP